MRGHSTMAALMRLLLHLLGDILHDIIVYEVRWETAQLKRED